MVGLPMPAKKDWEKIGSYNFSRSNFIAAGTEKYRCLININSKKSQIYNANEVIFTAYYKNDNASAYYKAVYVGELHIFPAFLGSTSGDKACAFLLTPNMRFESITMEEYSGTLNLIPIIPSSYYDAMSTTITWTIDVYIR